MGRGLIKEDFFADTTVFDPATIIDKATYAEPAQLSLVLGFHRLESARAKSTVLIHGKHHPSAARRRLLSTCRENCKTQMDQRHQVSDCPETP